MAIRVPNSTSTHLAMPHGFCCPPWSHDPRQLVVKVQYGNTLRRFCSSVDVYNLDLDLNQLKSFIISNFNLSSRANLLLSYLDSDGDVITFSTDEELRDAVVNQWLNPLRVFVALTSTNTAPSISDTSSVSSLANYSPSHQLPIPYVSQDPAPGRSFTTPSECSSHSFSGEDTTRVMTIDPRFNMDLGRTEASATYQLPMPDTNKKTSSINSELPPNSAYKLPVPSTKMNKPSINSEQPSTPRAWTGPPVRSPVIFPNLSDNFKVDQETELALLDELRELGFIDDFRNLSFLRRNDHDLDKTISYLYRTIRREKHSFLNALRDDKTSSPASPH